MNNDPLLDRLKEALQKTATTPPPEELEEFMSGPADPSTAAALGRMRKEFAEKVLLTLHPEPVKEAESRVTLGQWIKEVRVKARLSHGFIASALGETTSFVEGLETGEILPWAISADVGSQLATLFRLHFNSLKELVENSRKALGNESNESWEVQDLEQHTNACHPDSTGPDEDVGEAMDRWLEEVRQTLEEKQAHELLA